MPPPNKPNCNDLDINDFKSHQIEDETNRQSILSAPINDLRAGKKLAVVNPLLTN